MRYIRAFVTHHRTNPYRVNTHRLIDTAIDAGLPRSELQRSSSHDMRTSAKYQIPNLDASNARFAHPFDTRGGGGYVAA